MQNLLHNLFQTLVPTQIWVALAVASFGYISLQEHTVAPWPFLLLSGGLGGAAYQYIALHQGSRSRPYDIPGWLPWFWLVIYGVIAGVGFRLIGQAQLPWLLIVPGLITLLYPLSFRFPGRGFTSLRNFPGLKMFLIALTWAYLTVLVPTLLYGRLSTETALEFCLRLLLLCGLIIPFDIRDTTQDDRGLHTLPQRIGIGPARGWAQVLIFVYQLWVALRVLLFDYPPLWAGALIVGFEAAYWLARKARPDRPRWYYDAALEGVPILAALLLFLTDWFF